MNLDTKVLIVGAGPTGLMLANQLGRHGIRVILIDRHSGPAQQSRAMTVHARTLEIYSKLGIVDQAVELGRRGEGANMWAQGKQTAHIPLGEIDRNVSPYPFVLMLGQDDNERVLGARLKAWSVAVLWNTERMTLHQESGFVKATMKDASGSTRTIAAAYIAGCDGGRSAVRELSGITFPGEPYEHVFFVADTEASGPMVKNELNVYLWRNGFHLFFSMQGKNRWRVIGIHPAKLRGRDDVTFDELSPNIRREAGADLVCSKCLWFSTYRIHHRSAERFRDRRCFLLGDATHVHSPMGGQGMNTGLQDGYNLAWKLALVIKGSADEALLDSYEAECLPVAQRLLESTDRAFTLLVSEHWMAGLFRTRILSKIAACAMRFEVPKKLAFSTLSQTGIAYRDCPLSQLLGVVSGHTPRAGDRFPWLRHNLRPGGAVEDMFKAVDDRTYSLIVIGQQLPSNMQSRYGTLLRTHVIPDDSFNTKALAAAGIRGQAFLLLPLDGHIGIAGMALAEGAVADYFARTFIRQHGRSNEPASIVSDSARAATICKLPSRVTA